MDHSMTAEGFGVRLRPVRMDDAAFIAWLRNLKHARDRIGDSGDEAVQRAWLEDYFARSGDYYFIIETEGGLPVGTHGIYDIGDRSAELGRWVVQPEVWAAIPSYLLIFGMAFESLELEELRMTTASVNSAVISLHRKLNFRQTGIVKDARRIHGTPVDIVNFLADKSEWPRVREKLTPLARIAEGQIRNWEQTQ